MDQADDAALDAPLPFRTKTFLLPRLAILDPVPTRAERGGKGGWRMQMTAEYASIILYARSSPTNMLLAIDAELARFNFAAEYRVSDSLAIGAEIPFLHFSDGFLDSFLTDYHNFFGLPTGGREKVAKDTFQGVLRDFDGREQWRAKSGGIKLGTANLWSVWSPWERRFESGSKLTFGWKLGVSLPTGSKEYGLDLGGVSASVGAVQSYVDQGFSANLNTDVVFPLGYSLGDDRVYSVKSAYAKVSISGSVALYKRLHGAVQVAWNSDVFNKPDPVTPLGSSLLGTFGVHWLGEKWRYYLAFNEDLSADADADFSLQLSVSTYF